MLISHDLRRQFPDRRREKALRLLRVREERLHLLPQRFVVAACRRHERGALARVAVERSVAEVFDAPPALGVCHRRSPSSSRSNQSFASRQSRLTVSGDTWSTSAVSSTLKPPKNRNSTTWLFRASTSANASNARSSATTSNRRVRRGDEPFVQRHPLCAAPAFAVAARPGVIDENAPHQAGRDAKKVRAILPADAPGVGQSKKRLVHQRRGLQRVSAPLAAHVPSSQAAQLRLHERQQPLERAIIAVAPRPQQLGDRPG